MMRRKTNRGKYKRTDPHEPAKTFAKMLFDHVPAFVLERLEPVQEDLRNNLQGLDDVQRNNLREALSTLSSRLPDELEAWNNAFAEVMAHSQEAKFAELMRRLPDPPEEPAGIWDELTEKANESDETGIAACLILYDLGCAKAFKEFKRMR